MKGSGRGLVEGNIGIGPNEIRIRKRQRTGHVLTNDQTTPLTEALRVGANQSGTSLSNFK